MFFVLSKIFWYLVQPLVVVLLALAVAFVLLLLGKQRLAATFLGGGLALLAVLSLTPLGLLMMSPLENRFPQPELPDNIAGIIVLGGALDTRVASTRSEPELNDAADRITAGVTLARLYPEARLIFSGGSAELLTTDIAESVVAGQLFADLGLEGERLILEDQSRDTFENARFTKALAKPEKGDVWVLVTSAYHMPRSVGSFRQAGFDVLPYPVDYRTPSGPKVWQPSSASIRNVEKVHFSIREYIGLAAYWLTGRTNALFPAP
ncbi:YdcF family protein [Aureimonas fodinaquatilis]|uniref:YdcF family protein n=1 Tax=Aureimonas fodinaquatilis TaxID=2565783 RepID=A0A5B0DY71_9HYPH|nr:YdcF family protein [Aureimonas fodinaquatilis]KAA0970510.1 YdcF family protein [Aureimonas fodinaquatilis]